MMVACLVLMTLGNFSLLIIIQEYPMMKLFKEIETWKSRIEKKKKQTFFCCWKATQEIFYAMTFNKRLSHDFFFSFFFSPLDIYVGVFWIKSGCTLRNKWVTWSVLVNPFWYYWTWYVVLEISICLELIMCAYVLILCLEIQGLPNCSYIQAFLAGRFKGL